MIRFACPGCNTAFTVTDDKAGKTSNCPKCKTAFQIPEPEDAPAPPQPPAPPKSPPPSKRPANDPVQIAPCPKCKAKLDVMPEDLGEDVECPECGKVFLARLPGSGPVKSRFDDDAADDDRPRRRSRRDEDDDDFKDRPRKKKGSAAKAREAVATPATVLLVVGILGLLLGIAYGIYIFAGFDKPQQGVMVVNGQFVPAQNNAGYESWRYVGAVIGLLWGPAVIMGAMKMKNLQNYSSAIVGCVFAMLPCNAGCFLGLFIGIWCIVVLQKDFVRRSFES